jgi:hypothetical protein
MDGWVRVGGCKVVVFRGAADRFVLFIVYCLHVSEGEDLYIYLYLMARY